MAQDFSIWCWACLFTNVIIGKNTIHASIIENVPQKKLKTSRYKKVQIFKWNPPKKNTLMLQLCSSILAFISEKLSTNMSTKALFYLALYKIQTTVYIFLQLHTYSYILNKSLITFYNFLQLFTTSYNFLQLFLYYLYSCLQLFTAYIQLLQLLIAAYSLLHFLTVYSCILQLNRTRPIVVSKF